MRHAPRAPRPALGRAAWIACWAVFGIVLLNLNGVAAMSLQVGRLFSPVLLGCSLVALTGARNPLASSGIAGKTYLLFVVCYLAIGMASALQTATDPGSRSVLGVAEGVALSVLIFGTGVVAGFDVGLRGVDRQFLWRVFIIGAAASGSVYVSKMLPGLYAVDPSFWRDGRLSGFFANPNDAALVGCLTVGVGLGLLGLGARPGAVVAILCFVAGAVLLTLSRAGMILMVVGMSVAPLLLPRGRNLHRWVVASAMVAVAGGIAAAIAVGVLAPTLEERQQTRLEDTRAILTRGEISNASTGDRLALAREGLDLWLSHPLAGNGLGSLHRMPLSGLGPHNTFVLVGGEAGVVALAILLAFVAILLSATWTAAGGAYRPLGASVLLFFVGGCLVSHNMLEHRPFALLLGVCSGLTAAGGPGRPARPHGGQAGGRWVRSMRATCG